MITARGNATTRADPAPVRGQRRDPGLGLGRLRARSATATTRSSTGAVRTRSRSRAATPRPASRARSRSCPGTYGTSQTGVTDFVPSATERCPPVAVRPRAGGSGASRWRSGSSRAPLAGPGSDLLIAGDHPVQRLEQSPGPRPANSAARRRRRPARRSRWISARSSGRGRWAPHPTLRTTDGTWRSAGEAPGAGPASPAGTRPDRRPGGCPGCRLSFDGWAVSRPRDLMAGTPGHDSAGIRSIELLAPANVPVEVEVVDPTTRRTAARPESGSARPTAAICRRWAIATRSTRASSRTPGRTWSSAPRPTPMSPGGSRSTCRSVRSTSRSSPASTGGRIVARLEIDPGSRRLELPLERTLALHGGRWVTADTHVHFLAPSTALLQAAAEDVDLVNLLAAQWGDLFTNITDLPWGSMADPSGRRLIVVGTENRQNMLGHLALLGAHRPVINPLASGGPPEGRLAGALSVLLADWADRCRAAGGLVVAAHFPLPYAEIAADIVCRQDRRDRDPGAVARPRRSGGPRVVPLPQPRRPAAPRRGHRQDVRRGAGRGGPDATPTCSTTRPLSFDALGGRRPGRPDIRDVRADPRAVGRWSRAGRR